MDVLGSNAAANLNVSAVLGLTGSLDFTQQNVDLVISKIKALPSLVRQTITSKIRSGFAAFIAANFQLSTQYQKVISNMPDALQTAYGSTVAVALDSGWDLQLTLPVNSPGTADNFRWSTLSITSTQAIDGPGQFHAVEAVSIGFEF